ncbi:MAG: hypothetical protein GXO88_03720 [Chlorobi bacterium]|nr:hypothetical protein [Chlorobiota bacterium]
MKNNKCVVLSTLTLLMFSLNLLLLYDLYLNQAKEQIISIENDYDELYKFNEIVAGAVTNANYVKDSGYIVKVNDTIAIQPYLRVNFSSFAENNDKTPLLSLYEYSSVDSSFKFQDTIRYSGNYFFNYIVKDTGSKILFVRINMPINDTTEEFHIMLPIRTENNNNELSLLPRESDLVSLFDSFILKSQ